MRGLLAGVVIAGAWSSPCAAEPAALVGLQQLVGTWKAKTDKGGTIRVAYRSISSGSALVQTFVTPSNKETMTVFHADGPRVLATHYCAQGNQPRLVLDTALSDAQAFVFRYLDATNLPTPKSAHMVKLELRLESADAYTEIETYEENGTPDVTTLHFTRVR